MNPARWLSHPYSPFRWLFRQTVALPQEFPPRTREEAESLSSSGPDIEGDDAGLSSRIEIPALTETNREESLVFESLPREEGGIFVHDSSKILPFLLDGNIRACIELENEAGRPLVASAYMASCWSGRQKILQAVLRAGKPELLSDLICQPDAVTVLPVEFFRTLARRLATLGIWGDLEDLLFNAPLPAAYTTAFVMREAGIVPDRGRGVYWKELLGALPETFRFPLPSTSPVSSHSCFAVKAVKIQLSRDGTHLAVGFSDGTVDLWKVPGGRLLQRGGIGNEAVTCIAFHPSGDTVACGGSKGRLLLIKNPGGSGNETKQVLNERVTSLQFSHDKALLYIGGGRGSLVQYDLQSMQASGIPSAHGEEVTALLSGSRGHLWSGSLDGSVQCQDPAGRSILIGHSVFDKPVKQIREGEGGSYVTVSDTGGMYRIWDTESGRLLEMNLRDRPPGRIASAFSPVQDWFAEGFIDGGIEVYSLPLGSHHAKFQVHREGVSVLCFSPDGKRLIAGSRTGMIHVLQVSGKERPVFVQGMKGAIREIVASGRFFALLWWNGIVEIRDIETGDLLQRNWGRSGLHPHIAGCEATDLIALSGENGSLHLWSRTDWRFEGTIESYFPGITALAYSPDGTCLIVAGNTGPVEVIGIPGGEILRRFTAHSGSIHALACDPTGESCAAGGWDGAVHLYSLKSGEHRKLAPGHRSPVTSVTFVPRHDMIISTSQDRTARIWNLPTGSLRHILSGHTHVVSCSAASPDGGLLATGSFDTSIRLWSLSDGGYIGNLAGHGSQVTSLVFINQRLLASGDRDGHIGLWLLPGGDLIHLFPSRSGAVTGLVPGPGTMELISSHEAGTCHSWALPYTRAASHATPDDLICARHLRKNAEDSGDKQAESWRFLELLLSGSLHSAVSLSQTPPLFGGYDIEIAEG